MSNQVVIPPISKPWYQSKIIWAGVATTLLGVAPLVGAFAKVIEPASAVVIDAALVMISGILTTVFRIWFTDQPIS